MNQDISTMSTEELLSYGKQLQSEADLKGTSQGAKKVLLNSLYGALANNYFRHYRTRDAEAITISGQQMIKTLGAGISEYIASIGGGDPKTIYHYGDTDSCYFVIEEFVQLMKTKHKIPDDKLVDFIDKFVNENVQKCIRTTLDNLGDYMNFYQNALGAKRECIAKSGIWKAKKLYALHVWDMEGVRYDHPKVKVTGIETQKSSTPKVVRDALLKSLDILLGGTEQELRDYVEVFQKEFKTMPLEAISFPRSVNNVEKYVGADGMPIKGCPGHVRAAIAHNTAVSKLGIQDVPMITSGDKVLFCYMKPNPYHAASIAFVDRPPKELNLQNYIDYDTQFEKAFLAPLTSLMDAVKWGLTDVSSLDDFF